MFSKKFSLFFYFFCFSFGKCLCLEAKDLFLRSKGKSWDNQYSMRPFQKALVWFDNL